jgi:TRAP-type C4-dicarboxylate transport system substrate-binding protein
MAKRGFFNWMAVWLIAGLCLFAANGPAQAADKTIDLKFANYYPPVAAQSKICEDFIKDLEARTDGKVKVTYYPGGSLLNGPGMIKGIESGIADIGLSHIQYTPGRMPVSEACDQAVGFPSGWVATHVVSDFYNTFKPAEWDKVHPLVMFTNNPSVLVLTKPVKTMDDLKGLTIRAPGPLGEVIKALGGSPAPTPIVETYDAMSKGVVQGAFVSMETLKVFRFAEVAKYVTNAWQVGPTYTFYIVMNKRKYDKLPPDVKEVVDTLAGEYQERMPLVWNAIDYAGKKAGEEQGVEFTELSPAEFDRWEKAAAVTIDDYKARMKEKGFSEADIQKWFDFIAERNDYWTQKQIGLHIKSMTGPADMRP